MIRWASQMSDVALEAVHVVIVEEAVDDAYHADTSRMKPRSCY